ncbi:envelope stress sensor histidine kinase HitS [Paenibacillus sp. JCM 10914]|uniref:sensor histidine kinase n=1 Tax=Paenibacillus sp. JCM 10914 TaxID=1236974 RepID=UPI0003CC6691|nr:HAMP domain-containing sensor histidine kinase [Paenibacillus sp. JCM 10914]GAE08678.1 sensor histidine kinase [Paenibacillus sp. JCM 10914]
MRKTLKILWKIVRETLQTLLIFAVLGASWTAGTYVTRFVYTWTGTPPWDYVVQLINLFTGVIIFFICILLVGLLFKHRQIAVLTAITDAMRRISQGDFNVKMDDREWRGEFKMIASSINDMAGELGRMETMRQDFISNVSHEIQSPLTSIRGFARALRKPNLPEVRRDHYLEIIEGEARRLSQLSDNLLKLSSLEGEQQGFVTDRYRLDRQLRTIVSACEPQWLAKNIQVSLELAAVEIVATEDLLSQVWTNLLHNSIKFTPDSGAITITLNAAEQEATVNISDTGVGISETDQLRIFERFYKADKSRNRALGGSGLGLSIVKRILDIHKGSVSVQSQLGQGSTFTVHLPLKPCASRE